MRQTKSKIFCLFQKKNKLAGVRPEREIITMHAKAEVTAVLKFNLVFSDFFEQGIWKSPL